MSVVIVPELRAKFRGNTLNLFANASAGSRIASPKRQICLYFPAKQGNSETETGSLMTASTANNFLQFKWISFPRIGPVLLSPPPRFTHSTPQRTARSKGGELASPIRRRERKLQPFKSPGSPQRYPLSLRQVEGRSAGRARNTSACRCESPVRTVERDDVEA